MSKRARVRSEFVVAIVVAGLFGLSFAAQAQAQEPSPEELQKLMAQSMELAQPGPEHARLAQLEGDWDVQLKIWMTPDAEPVMLEGKGHAEMFLGGRFLRMTSSFTEGPFPADTESILGFDRRKNEYTILGFDTMGTYWVSASGPFEEEGQRTVLYGEDEDPIFKNTQKYDIVFYWVDENTYRSEVIFKDKMHTGGGEPLKMVEVTGTRVTGN